MPLLWFNFQHLKNIYKKLDIQYTNMEEYEENLLRYLYLVFLVILLSFLVSHTFYLYGKANQFHELSTLSYKEGKLNNIFVKNYWGKGLVDVAISLNDEPNSYYFTGRELKIIYYPSNYIEELKDKINREISAHQTKNLKIWYFGNNEDFKRIAQLIVDDSMIISYDTFKETRIKINKIDAPIFVFFSISVFILFCICIWSVFFPKKRDLIAGD